MRFLTTFRSGTSHFTNEIFTFTRETRARLVGEIVLEDNDRVDKWDEVLYIVKVGSWTLSQGHTRIMREGKVKFMSGTLRKYLRATQIECTKGNIEIQLFLPSGEPLECDIVNLRDEADL